MARRIGTATTAKKMQAAQASWLRGGIALNWASSSMPPFYQRSKKPCNRRGAKPAYTSNSLSVQSRGVMPAAMAGVDASRNSFSLADASRYNDPMKYSLRSLMVVVLVLPPLLAIGWFRFKEFWSEGTPPAYPGEIVVIYHTLMDEDDARDEDWSEAQSIYKGRLGSNP